MRWILIVIFAVFAAPTSKAVTLSFESVDYGAPPSPLSFNIPSEPGTAGVYVVGATGSGGMFAIYDVVTPIFIVPVTGSLTIFPVYVADQYGDEGYLGPFFSLTGNQPQNFFPWPTCNVNEGTCGSLVAPDPITVDFTLPAYSQISFLEGTITISAVPEPSTWALLVIGFAAIGFVSYRRSSTGKRARCEADREDFCKANSDMFAFIWEN
jgi:hypothetical protein